jgi:hypothetical protein
MERNDRDGRDAAGIGPYARERETLTPLSALESWTVSDGEPDIRGWEVRTVSGRQLGSVADLLIDQAAGEVVLLDIDLPGTDRHTYVPIRVAALDRTRRIVLMDSADIPSGGTTRGPARRADDGRPTTSGTVRYPVADREVDPGHGGLADAAPPPPKRTAATVEPSSERRYADRRRIDRISTDL